MKLGQDGILYSTPRYQNDMNGLSYDNWPRCWKENNRGDFRKLKDDIHHMTGVLEVTGKDGTLRSPNSLNELRTSLLCTLNIVANLISLLEAKDEHRPTGKSQDRGA